MSSLRQRAFEVAVVIAGEIVIVAHPATAWEVVGFLVVVILLETLLWPAP